MLNLRNFFLVAFLFLTLSFLSLLFPKPTNAQQCTGSPVCGNNVSQLLCSGDQKTPCFTDADCTTAGGTCQTFGSCQSTGVPGSCYCSGADCNTSGTNFICLTTCPCVVSGGCTKNAISPPPTPTPGPTSPPGWQACGSCNCGRGANGTGECQLDPNGVCQWNPCYCAGVNCGGGGSDPCPNDSCPGYCCNYICGQHCSVTADCAPPTNGQPPYCNPVTQTCANANCPNNTDPGTICGCNGGLTCGQKCAGGCTGQSICTFTNGGTCSDASTTYCVGVSAPNPINANSNYSTFNPSMTGALCSPGAWHLVNNVTGQNSGFTPAQINSTCKPVAWWQVKDGDVVTNGRIQSLIPIACTLPTCTPYFNLDGTGGFPGVVVYGSSFAPNFTVSGGAGTVSSKKWLANTTYNGKTYSYSYFEGLIPSDVQVNDIATDTISGNYFQVNGTPKNNFVWFRRTGNLTITGNVNVNNTRRVILLVKGGNLNISSTINVQKVGDGFFMGIVNGNINIDPALTNTAGKPALEGLFLSDGVIHTGLGNQQLYVRGTLAAQGGISLERDLQNNNANQPAELIEYAPDLIFSYPRDLAKSRVIWREVAP